MPRSDGPARAVTAKRPRHSAAKRPHYNAVVRPATASDLEAVERIEREQFSNPWTREYYAAELQNDRCHFVVAIPPPGGAPVSESPIGVHAGPIAGYLLFWRIGAELELHKITVAAAWQRQGHASRLMDFFVQKAHAWDCERAWLEVRAHNLPAIRLYEKYRFHCVGCRRNYYTAPVEDALVYELVF